MYTPVHFLAPSNKVYLISSQITASVYDDANPESVATTNLTITVRRNENEPRFQRSDYSVNVLEIAPIGTSLAQLSATDRDNDKLEYYVCYSCYIHVKLINQNKNIAVKCNRAEMFKLFL